MLIAIIFNIINFFVGNSFLENHLDTFKKNSSFIMKFLIFNNIFAQLMYHRIFTVWRLNIWRDSVVPIGVSQNISRLFDHYQAQILKHITTIGSYLHTIKPIIAASCT